MTVEQARETARRMLSDERFFHTECVAKAARRLAARHGEDPERAETAGLLHDIAKEMPEADLLQMVRRSDIIDFDEIRECPPVWHAYAGGVYLRETFGADEDIVNAVACHTTGRAGMSKLEKIVYLADYVSDDRTFGGAGPVRALAEESLDGAMLLALRSQAAHLMKHSRYIDPGMIRAYNDLIKTLEPANAPPNTQTGDRR